MCLPNTFSIDNTVTEYYHRNMRNELLTLEDEMFQKRVSRYPQSSEEIYAKIMEPRKVDTTLRFRDSRGRFQRICKTRYLFAEEDEKEEISFTIKLVATMLFVFAAIIFIACTFSLLAAFVASVSILATVLWTTHLYSHPRS